MGRWKTDEERGEFGAWLTSKVGERTFEWLAAEMAARGHKHDPSYYRAMASGNKRPGRDIGRALREFFGDGPAPSPPPLNLPAILEAIDRQTAAISRLAAALEAQDAERRRWDAGLVDVLRIGNAEQRETAEELLRRFGDLARRLAPPGTLVADGPGARERGE